LAKHDSGEQLARKRSLVSQEGGGENRTKPVAHRREIRKSSCKRFELTLLSRGGEERGKATLKCRKKKEEAKGQTLERPRRVFRPTEHGRSLLREKRERKKKA